MGPFQAKKHRWRASWGFAISLIIGTFQFMAIAEVLFVVPPILVMMLMLPTSIKSKKTEPAKGAAFTSNILLLVSAFMFLTTTPAIIIAWAFRLRDGYDLKTLAVEAGLLAAVTVITAIATMTATFAKKDLDILIFTNNETPPKSK